MSSIVTPEQWFVAGSVSRCGYCRQAQRVLAAPNLSVKYVDCDAANPPSSTLDKAICASIQNTPVPAYVVCQDGKCNVLRDAAGKPVVGALPTAAGMIARFTAPRAASTRR